MSRVSIVVVLFVCVVLASGYVNANLLKSNDVETPANDKKEPTQNAVIEDVIKDVPEEVAPKCKKIGEFVSTY